MGCVASRLAVALTALRMRGERPVRIWLTRKDGALLLFEHGHDPNRVVGLRYQGVPVSVCAPPAVSRVVGESGVVEII